MYETIGENVFLAVHLVRHLVTFHISPSLQKSLSNYEQYLTVMTSILKCTQLVRTLIKDRNLY